MNKTELIKKIEEFVQQGIGNFVAKEDAIYPELSGMKIYDAPLVGIAAADDELFTETFKKPGVIHPDYLAPKEWLPEAKCVISFFLPFTEEVKESNINLTDIPYKEGLKQASSAQWLHARIEGQMFLNTVTDYIQKILEEEGYKTVCPTTSGKWALITPVISNWSERHAAYAAGLGTFGLSKGLITKKGMAGRFGSVITDAVFEADKRPYTDPFEYCIMCGACQVRCPAKAIDKTRGCALGKDQTICKKYLDDTFLPPHGPNQRKRYGCGKCQVATPCSSGIPNKGE